MAYKLIWSPAARDNLHDIVSLIRRQSSPRRNIRVSPHHRDRQVARLSRALAELSLSIACQLSVKSLSDLTGLFTASITSGSSSRLHEYGMQVEVCPNYKAHEKKAMQRSGSRRPVSSGRRSLLRIKRASDVSPRSACDRPYQRFGFDWFGHVHLKAGG